MYHACRELNGCLCDPRANCDTSELSEFDRAPVARLGGRRLLIHQRTKCLAESLSDVADPAAGPFALQHPLKSAVALPVLNQFDHSDVISLIGLMPRGLWAIWLVTYKGFSVGRDPSSVPI